MTSMVLSGFKCFRFLTKIPIMSKLGKWVVFGPKINSLKHLSKSVYEIFLKWHLMKGIKNASKRLC